MPDLLAGVCGGISCPDLLGQQSEGDAFGRDSQGSVRQQSLVLLLGQRPKPTGRWMVGPIEQGGVLDGQNQRYVSDPLGGSPHMAREDGFGANVVVIEKTICGLEHSRIVGSLWE